MPGLTEGFLLVDLTSSISFPWVVPASGKIDWTFNMKPNIGIYLQNVSFRVLPLLGTFSNRFE